MQKYFGRYIIIIDISTMEFCCYMRYWKRFLDVILSNKSNNVPLSWLRWPTKDLPGCSTLRQIFEALQQHQIRNE
jgi:hypothetical protein